VGDEWRGALQHDADRRLRFKLRPKRTIAAHRCDYWELLRTLACPWRTGSPLS
jgi:hypothetical protein